MRMRLFGNAGSVVVVLFLSAFLTQALCDGFGVGLDIKPWSCPNSINLNSNGVIPVAILTNYTFDAATVDPATVVFAGAAPEGAPHFEDADGDGDLDLVFHFRTQQTNIQPGDVGACLTGQTLQGAAFFGCDYVNTVPAQ